MKRVFKDGDYRIIENNDGGTPFTAWMGTTHLGDYHTLESAKARCARDKRALERKAEGKIPWNARRA